MLQYTDIEFGVKFGIKNSFIIIIIIRAHVQYDHETKAKYRYENIERTKVGEKNKILIF